jgi:hypothetical protein
MRTRAGRANPIEATRHYELCEPPEEFLVHLVAPKPMEAGFKFENEIVTFRKWREETGHEFPLAIQIVVPPGGVKRGHDFYESVPLPKDASSLASWRDGLLDLFRYGVCHPHVRISLCCPYCKSSLDLLLPSSRDLFSPRWCRAGDGPIVFEFRGPTYFEPLAHS